MAHNVSNEYKQVIYSGDAKNNLKILFNNVELQNADLYCEKLTVTSRIIPNGSKIFNLNNFISKEADLILHDIDTSIIQDQVSISIGTLVGNSYEYVPIGIFNIQDTPTNDKNKTTIKLRDNSVKFDFNYNAQDLIEANNGRATKIQILQDICTQAGVTCNITSFIGYVDEIGVYDNTITARQYIANIAEQAGKIATINRSGELIFVDLNNLTTWEIPIDIVEKYENGTTYKIGKVVYEDGIVRYETDDSNDDTLFLDGSNNYINGELVREQASSNEGSYNLQDTGEAQLAKFQLEGKTTQETRSGKNLIHYATGSTYLSNLTVVENSNGTINISGTPNRTWANLTPNINKVFEAGTYTFSITQATSFNVGIRLFNDESDYTQAYINQATMSATFTTTKTFNYYRIFFEVLNTSTNYSINNFGFQLEKGNQKTNYEKYGAMPSPDYPSDLVSVGYKNLLNIAPLTSKTNNGLKIVRTDDYITITQTRTSTGWVSLIDFTLPVGTYTFSYVANGTIPREPKVLKDWEQQANTFTVSSSSQTYRIAVGGSVGDVWNGTLKLQIQKGEQVYNYIPYGKYGIEVINVGSNILKLTGTNGTTNGVTFTFNEDGTIKANGTASADINKVIVSKIPLDNTKQYTLSGTTGGAYSTYHLRVCTLSWGDNNFNHNGYNTFTPRDTANYQVTIEIRNGVQLNNVIFKPMLVIGSKEIVFEEYKSNSQLYTLDEPLRAIGNYKDKLYIENGTLKVERKIGKTILNGTENWGHWNNAFYCDVAFDYLKATGITTICNYFKGSNNNTGGASAYNNGNYTISLYKNSDYNRIYIRNDDKSTADGFKTWLSTHNTEVNYVLATPTIEELGDIELPTTYEKATNITLNNGIDTYSYLQYRKDKTQLEAILNEVDEFDINSLKTGKILGNPAIDSYDLIQIHDKSKNLFKVNALSSGIVTSYTNGEIVANGATTASTYYSNIGIANLSTGTYHFSFNSSLNLPSGSRILLIKNGTAEHLVYDNNNFTISAPTEYMIGLVLNTGNFSNVIIRPQIEKGNVATDYVPFKDEIYTTLATNDLVYTGVLINTFDTQIGEEAKEQNVFVNGEETFKKWARTTIDNVEGALTLQAGKIDEANGRINQTNLTIDSQGALLNVIANNSNIDIAYDGDTPVSGQVREVTTTTGFTFNAEGMTIEDSQSNFKALHRNTGTYYQDGTTIVGQYTKDGSKQKDLDLFGVYTYGKNDINETPMFIAQLFTDGNGEECFGHFYNRGD